MEKLSRAVRYASVLSCRDKHERVFEIGGSVFTTRQVKAFRTFPVRQVVSLLKAEKVVRRENSVQHSVFRSVAEDRPLETVQARKFKSLT